MSEAAEAHLPLRGKPGDGNSAPAPKDNNQETTQQPPPPILGPPLIITPPQAQLNGSVKVPVVEMESTTELQIQQDGKIEENISENEGHSLCKWPKGRGWFTQVCNFIFIYYDVLRVTYC